MQFLVSFHQIIFIKTFPHTVHNLKIVPHVFCLGILCIVTVKVPPLPLSRVGTLSTMQIVGIKFLFSVFSVIKNFCHQLIKY